MNGFVGGEVDPWYAYIYLLSKNIETDNNKIDKTNREKMEEYILEQSFHCVILNFHLIPDWWEIKTKHSLHLKDYLYYLKLTLLKAFRYVEFEKIKKGSSTESKMSCYNWDVEKGIIELNEDFVLSKQDDIYVLECEFHNRAPFVMFATAFTSNWTTFFHVGRSGVDYDPELTSVWKVTKCEHSHVQNMYNLLNEVSNKFQYSSPFKILVSVDSPPSNTSFNEDSLVIAVPNLIEDIVPSYQQTVKQKSTTSVQQFVANLNESQMAAMTFCTSHLTADNQNSLQHLPTGSIIVGPPGCGKTTFSVAAVHVYLAFGKSVLMCSPSNTEVILGLDSFVKSVSVNESFPKCTLVGNHDILITLVTGTLVGAHITSNESTNLLASNFRLRLELSLTNIAENWDNNSVYCMEINNVLMSIMSVRLKKLYVDNVTQQMHLDLQSALQSSDGETVKDIVNELISHYSDCDDTTFIQEYVATAEVVFCALSYCGQPDTISMFHIDTVILDETGIEFEAELLLASINMHPEHVILVGDPHQLSTGLTIDCVGIVGGLTFSFSEMPFILLNMQHRMHPTIAQISNDAFYNNTIQNHPSVVDRNCGISSTTNAFISCRCSIIEIKSNLRENCSGDYDWCDMKEGFLIVKMVIKLQTETNCKFTQIQILTLSSSQADLINKQLSMNPITRDQVTNKACCVDAFAGCEADYVIASYMCRLSHYDTPLFHRRLKLMWSRAKHALISVCDINSWLETDSVSEIFKQFVKLNTVFEKKHLHSHGLV